jgi:putative hydrolase of the HAD superfamily
MSDLSNFDVVVFDLDDTLYSEKDYVLSGYRYLADLIERLYSKITYQSFLDAITKNKADVFDYVIAENGLPVSLKQHLILAYRYHAPIISLHAGVIEVFNELKTKAIPMYLITDGRGVTQRLKISSLGIEGFFEDIYISEEVGAGKPELKSFAAIDLIHPQKSIVYIADNPKKDFIAPKELGWKSVGILNLNTRVHPLTNNYIETADLWLNEFKELTC